MTDFDNYSPELMELFNRGPAPSYTTPYTGLPKDYTPAPIPMLAYQPPPMKAGLSLLGAPMAAPHTQTPMYVFPVGAPKGPPRQDGTNGLEPYGITVDQLIDLQRRKESSGNYQAKNPKTSASGAYQYIDSTWNGYGGYAKAMFAPKEIQDRRFNEDIRARLQRYGYDPFKTIAEHYLPALANKPNTWTQPYKLKNGSTVAPVADYIRYVVKGSPLEKAFNEYLSEH